VAAAETDWVVMINSDMYVSDYWLDALVQTKLVNQKSLPCSLLVESGRIPSAMPEYVHNFGTSVDSFDREGWQRHAAALRERKAGKREPGRLFMPVLVDRQEFADVGGYPPGNIQTTTGTLSGDRDLFNRYAARGYEWVTCLDSIVFHTQEGEMRG
jgi:GT2 family glycosyltransferase